MAMSLETSVHSETKVGGVTLVFRHASHLKKKSCFFPYSLLLSTNYLYFKFQSISMLHYEVIHYFLHAIPVIKLLNAYPQR